ncbi:MAG: hypothetical protein DLM58_08180 [Pseudonocardiales bacterium]|nr:MAG: hypothetical protein DLM58_08180 [Pseudonocardiales bacterium]
MRRRLSPATGEFDGLFEQFRDTAFRLETLQWYDVPYEAEMVRRFLAGHPPPSPPHPNYQWWRRLLRAGVAANRQVQRVRMVAEPLTDYLRFEMAWAYPDNVAAGEDIRVIVVNGAEWPNDLPGCGYDFWLFDEGQLATMHYDHRGRFIAIDLLDERSSIEQALQWRDSSLRSAVPFNQYVSAMGKGGRARVGS